MSGFAEVKPYYGPTDEVEAGRVWRVEKFKDFEWRAKSAGIIDDPEVQALLHQMQQEIVALDEIAERDRKEGRLHWWCDGEYDANKAEENNDLGAECFKSREYGPAFDHYTEAIRLQPSKAVYHCNRAAAALKLGKFQIAVEDAEYALTLDSAYDKALMRAAKGHMALGKPENAVAHLIQALKLNPSSPQAAEFLLEAEESAKAKEATRAAERASAQRGERAPLPLHALPEEEAADLLHAADEMAAAQPDREPVKAARAEALIHCRRYDDAEQACKLLVPDSVDTLYLLAELYWRTNRPEEALARLDQGLAIKADSAKCLTLRDTVQRITQNVAAAKGLQEDGEYSRAIEAYTLALAADPSRTSRFTAAILTARAACQYDAGHLLDDALKDLTHALLLEPNTLDALLTRAKIYQERGEYELAFLDLRRAERVNPQTPGIFAAMEDMAKRALGRGGADPAHAAGGAAGAAAAGEFYKLLGVSLKASQKDITRAYRKMAAKWHPDKWNQATDKRKKQAEAMFKKVAEAYETLKDPDQRRVYNAGEQSR